MKGNDARAPILPSDGAAAPRGEKRYPPWAPYVVPFGIYLLLTGVEVRFRAIYPEIYCAKILLVAVLAFVLRPARHESPRLTPPRVAFAVALGVALNWVWIWLAAVTPHPLWITAILGKRPGLNPFADIPLSLLRDPFLVCRFAGLVLLIPCLEENFYRNFVLRYAVKPDDFRLVPIGVMEPVAVAFSTVLFASTHPEWLSAIVFALVMCALVWRTGDIRTCMIAHGAANLTLGIYVLATHAWQLW